MTDYKHHLLGGMIVTLAAGAIIFWKNILPLNLSNVSGMIFISLFFSLLPDADIGTSMIRKIISCAIGAAMIGAFIVNASYIGIALALILIGLQFLKHRGIMHSLLIGAVFSGLLYIYFGNWIFSGVAMLNFLSHLLLDQT